jgi:hypothetical protein
MPKDPKRWSDPLIATPNVTLTKRDVHDYYAQKSVQKRIRAAVGAGDMLVRQSFEPGNNVLRRKSPEGDNIKFKDLLKIPRITEAHQTFGKKVNFLLADVDPQPGVPWEKTKSIAETIAKTMAMHDDVKDVQVRFSGNRGFYVQGNMDKKIDVNKAREVTKKVLHGIAQRPDVTFGIADKGQIRIDLTPLKNKGSIKAPYSLDARTGLVSAPVKVDDIGKVKKTDFEIGKIKMAAIKNATIRHENGKYVLYNRAGTKVLGRHPSKEKALSQERAIQVSKRAKLVKSGSQEFAPGIPASRAVNTIPTAQDKTWTLAVQKHEAERAGTHYDLRLVDPTTSQAHSFAIPKARLPDSNDRPLLAVQQPTHTADYALRFTGTIPKGTYGAGKVTMPIKEKVQIIQSNADKIKFQRPNGTEFVLFRMQGNNWGLKKKKTS